MRQVRNRSYTKASAVVLVATAAPVVLVLALLSPSFNPMASSVWAASDEITVLISGCLSGAIIGALAAVAVAADSQLDGDVRYWQPTIGVFVVTTVIACVLVPKTEELHAFSEPESWPYIVAMAFLWAIYASFTTVYVIERRQRAKTSLVD